MSVCIPEAYSHVEIVAVDLLNCPTKVRLIVCYRPPGYANDPLCKSYISDLCACIECLMPRNSTVVICGDFNFPSIDWKNIDSGLCSNDTCVGIFLNFYYKHALNQYILQPTRSTLSSSSTLDLIMCNDINFVFDPVVSAPFSSSDHSTVGFKIISSIGSLINDEIATFDFSQADWSGLCSFLHTIDFDKVFNDCDHASNITNAFYDIIRLSISNFVPVITRSSKSKHRNYPIHIKRRLARKSTAWRVYKSFRTPESLIKYKRLASECRSLIHLYVLNYESNIINSSNTSKFYRYANNRFCCKSAVGPLKDSSGNILTDPRRKAELLSSVFSECFTVDNNCCPSISKFVSDSTSLSSITFTPGLVRKSIQHLKSKSKGGPDCVPPIFYKKCSLWLCEPLTYVFQSCFDHGYLPPIWLQAFITPVYKKGPASDPLNYRPIALTCIMCKLLEFIIKNQLLSYLLNNNLISKQQHAFILKHSTATNLLECIHDWSIALNDGSSVDVIYIDFRRAFDSIVHSKLLYKLQCYGICGKLLTWISAFLFGRTQSVVVDNTNSTYINVVSGVPQGSVLGPLLFILFINDIDQVCHFNTKLKLFADDVKMYSVIEKNNSCSSTLQQSISNICRWAELWQFGINPNKTTVNILCNYSASCSRFYSINNVPLPNCNNMLDLGITVDSNLTFKDHVNNIVSKSTQRCGVLFRGFASRQLPLLRKAFTTYIRPILEYNSCIWNPSHKQLVDSIENVQRRFTKRIPCLSSLSYPERLATIDLESLELRRLHTDLVMYFKILNNLTPLPSHEYFNFFYPPSSSRTLLPLLQKPAKGSVKYFSSFFNRSIDCWNSLGTSVRSADSLSKFKSLLYRTDLSKFLVGNVYN